MFHSLLSNYAGAAYALLASLRAAEPPDKVAIRLVDALDLATKDTRHYKAVEPAAQPPTWAAALLVLADELPAATLPQVLGRTHVYVGDAWRPLQSLYEPVVTAPVPVAAPVPAAMPDPLLSQADQLLGGTPAPAPPPTPTPTMTVTPTPTPAPAAVPTPGPAGACRPGLPLDRIDVVTPVGRAKKSPFGVEVDEVPLRGRRPKWMLDLLALAPFVLTESPNDLIGNGSRGPARAGAALVLVRLAATLVSELPDDVTVAELAAWLQEWQSVVMASPLGPALDKFATALLADEPESTNKTAA